MLLTYINMSNISRAITLAKNEKIMARTSPTTECKDHFAKCSLITLTDCAHWEIRIKCPLRCGTCRCKDGMYCNAPSPTVCSIVPNIRERCPKSCGMCGTGKNIVYLE